jgi:NitT/TauT family transport system ATP-binding protein
MTTNRTDPVQASRQPVLTVQGLSKVFRSQSGSEVCALSGLDLTVERGEFVVLVGPTGCGKTTLLNIVGGLERQDRGEVRFAAGPGRENRVSYVFQHYTLFPWRTLLRNVTFGLQMRGVGRAERNDAARELLSNVGLSDFQNAYPHELSGGMRQRAAIAQALVTKPDILLMDEPFGALDDATRKDLQQLLVTLWQDRGATVLFVTHNIDEAVIMGGRILVFSGRPGKIVKDIAVDLPHPRDGMSSGFTEKYVEVRQAFYSGVGGKKAS